MIKISFTVLSLLLLSFTCVTHAARPSLPSENSEIIQWLDSSISPRSWKENIAFMQEFASANEAACKTWSPKAFEVQEKLFESCQFAPLLRRYLAKLKKLNNENASGIILPQVPLNDSALPILQSGAWQGLIMSEVDGMKSALEIITLRIALEKSLRAHASLVRAQSYGVFSAFAALTVPRMIAAFSAYSQTLQRLVFIDAFECGAERTKACTDVKAKLSTVKSELLLGSDSEAFLQGLTNMSAENSSREQLKAQQVQKVAKLIEALKTEVRLKDLLKSLNGSKVHPIYQQLETELNALTSSGFGASNADQAGMLVAVSVLSEISDLQKRKSAIAVSNSVLEGPQTKRAKEEISKLQSLVLKTLSVGEAVP